jgi:hypothetical protein
MAFGLPLPICSCGVVPVYRSLVMQGVPVSAAMSFLVATPELSLDAVLISLPLLGGEFTILRVLCAALAALGIGWGVGRLAPAVIDTIQSAVPEEQERGIGDRLRRSLNTGLGEVVDDTAPWIVLGLSVAAIAAPLLEAGWLLEVPDAAQVLLFAILGIPIYVCASGATPLAAVLVFKGVSPGAALAFLLTGPATNLTTFGVLTRLHGRRLALFFAGGIMALALALGLGVNLAVPTLTVPPLAMEEWVEWWSVQGLCLLGLSVLFLSSLLRVGPRAFVAEVFSTDGEDEGHHHDHDDDCASEYSHCCASRAGEHQHS